MLYRVTKWAVALGIAQSAFLTAEWTTPVDVSTSGVNATAPSVAVDPKGNATAVWRQGDNTFVVQASTRPYGGSWQTTPSPISPTCVDSSLPVPRVAVDPNGNATAIWRYLADGASNGIIQASTKLNGAWTSPAGVSPSDQDAVTPWVAVDPNGNATVIWSQPQSNAAGIIQASTKPYGGAWPATPDHLGGQGGDSPKIRIDSRGNATAIWNGFFGSWTEASTKPFGGTWQAVPDMFSGQVLSLQLAVNQNGDAASVYGLWNALIQASTKPYGGNWQDRLDNLSLTGHMAFDYDPQIAIDGHGNITAVWMRLEGNVSAIPIIQAITRPYGGEWQSSPDTLAQGFAPKIVADEQGNVTVVFVQGDQSTGSGIIQAVTKSYKGTWSNPVTLSQNGNCTAPDLAVDVNGNVTFVWDWNDGTNNIVQSCTHYVYPFPPSEFSGSGVVNGKKMSVKAGWMASPSTDVVRYEIYARNKRIKTIPADRSLEAVIRLHPRHRHNSFSSGYRLYIHNKYGVRAIDSSGAASEIVMLDTEGLNARMKSIANPCW